MACCERRDSWRPEHTGAEGATTGERATHNESEPSVHLADPPGHSRPHVADGGAAAQREPERDASTAQVRRHSRERPTQTTPHPSFTSRVSPGTDAVGSGARPLLRRRRRVAEWASQPASSTEERPARHTAGRAQQSVKTNGRLGVGVRVSRSSRVALFPRGATSLHWTLCQSTPMHPHLSSVVTTHAGRALHREITTNDHSPTCVSVSSRLRLLGVLTSLHACFEEHSFCRQTASPPVGSRSTRIRPSVVPSPCWCTSSCSAW